MNGRFNLPSASLSALFTAIPSVSALLAGATCALLLISCSCREDAAIHETDELSMFPAADDRSMFPAVDSGLVDRFCKIRHIRSITEETARPMGVLSSRLHFIGNIIQTDEYFYGTDGRLGKSVRYDGRARKKNRVSMKLYTYEHSRLSRITYADGDARPYRRDEFVYDSSDRLSGIRTVSWPDTATVTRTLEYAYDQSGRMTQSRIFFRNGVTITDIYDYCGDGTCLVTRRDGSGKESRRLIDAMSRNLLESYGEDGAVTHRCFYDKNFLIKEIKQDEVSEYTYFPDRSGKSHLRMKRKNGKWIQTVRSTVKYWRPEAR